MKVINPPEKIEFVGKSIFLAGPTPRSINVPSWRPEAINVLEQLHFKGTVLVPESDIKPDYIEQVEWEWEGLENCDVIVFWVPRDLATMPAFITNVEFGSYVRSGRAYYGRPDDCPGNGYLDWLYEKVTKRKPHNSLISLLASIIEE